MRTLPKTQSVQSPLERGVARYSDLSRSRETGCVVCRTGWASFNTYISMKKIFTFIALSGFLIFSASLFTSSANAQDLINTRSVDQEMAFETASGLNAGASVSETVSLIITIVLGLLGILFLVLMVYAGFLWMTAQGDEEKVAKATKMITAAVIGLIIIIAAYSITYFIFNSLNDATYDLK
jgi:hypothetical protein